MKHSGCDMNGIEDLVISTVGRLIVSSLYRSLERWDARTGEQIGDYIKVPDCPEYIVISSDGETIVCRSKGYDYVQKWETKTGKHICEPMKWSDGKHILDEMERGGIV